MTLEDIRAELKGWALDLELLRPHLDTNQGEAADLAWAVARAKFLKACEIYAAVVPEMHDKLK